MTWPYNRRLPEAPGTQSRHPMLSIPASLTARRAAWGPACADPRPGRPVRGFTLIELLVVLAILTLLAGLVRPRVLNQLGGAKAKTALVQIADLVKILELL